MDGLNRESGRIGSHSEGADMTPAERYEQSLWGSHTVSPVSVDPYLQRSCSMDSGYGSGGENSVVQKAIADKRTERFISPRDEGKSKKTRKKRAGSREKLPSREKSDKTERQNQKRENSSRIDPLSSYQIMFSTMSPADCQAHLEIIIAIEEVLIDAVHSARSIKNTGGDRSRYLNLEQLRKLRQYLNDWQQLAPAGTSLSIRDQMEKALDANDLGQLRQLFPIHESGSFQQADGQKRIVLHYEGLRSKQVASVLDVLNNMNRQ